MLKKKVYSKNKILNERVKKVLSVLKKFEKDERYRACLVFGSAVRGEFREGSDIDVKVAIRKGKHHSELNHTYIEGIKLDISFNSLERLQKDTEKELERAKRPPLIAESVILFDKDGDARKLIAHAKKKMYPKKYDKAQYDWVRFVILNEDLKVRRYFTEDPVLANYIMHSGLEDVIDMHYQVEGRFDTSNKKTLSDLKKWDPVLEKFLIRMMSAKNMKDKFSYWTKIIDHVLKKLGGRIDIEETSCTCQICREDIGFLKSLT